MDMVLQVQMINGSINEQSDQGYINEITRYAQLYYELVGEEEHGKFVGWTSLCITRARLVLQALKDVSGGILRVFYRW